jgi:hypothetical protein
MSLLISSSSYIKRPDTISTIVSICAYVAFLFATEHFSRAVLEKIGPFVHVLFDEDHEHNRKVVARHLGVDLVACASVSVIGVRSRKYLSQIRARFWDSKVGREDFGLGQGLGGARKTLNLNPIHFAHSLLSGDVQKVIRQANVDVHP